MSTFTASQTVPTPALDHSLIQNTHRPGLSAIFVLLGDILSLILILGTFASKTIIGRYASDDWLLRPLLILAFLALYWFVGSYPGVSVNPVAEIRRISLANSCAFLFITAISANHLAMLPCLIWLPASIASSAVILVLRSLVRQVGSQYDWWGYPVVLVGRGNTARFVLCRLIGQPQLGLTPVAVIADQLVEKEIQGIPVLESRRLGELASSGIRHAIVAAPELSRSEFARVIERGGETFPHLILVPDMDFVWKVESYMRDLSGITGIEMRNNLLDSRARGAKRAIDLASSIVLMVLLLPLMTIISLLIVAESGCPVFFSQERLGRAGRTFHIWKFRSMVRNSAEVLEHHLDSCPQSRSEWAVDHKLRNDPRITRVGRLLRKTSLDELPQLWNVILGEMSLVGPRPIVAAEIPKYQAAYILYMKMTPGLTGLWQVSGRSHTTYAERIAYDICYVRNWSFWMDIYLLAKTVGVIFTGNGAY